MKKLLSSLKKLLGKPEVVVLKSAVADAAQKAAQDVAASAKKAADAAAAEVAKTAEKAVDTAVASVKKAAKKPAAKKTTKKNNPSA